MPIKKKAILLQLAAASNFVALILSAGRFGAAALWFCLIVMTVFLTWFALLKCPRCGSSVFVRNVRFLGLTWRLSVWRFAPDRCRRCGLSFGED
jgi:hypothetical protein